MGQHLMRSESKGMPGSMRSVCPSLVSRLVFSSQENPECQGFLQLEQNSDVQVGQWTLWGSQRSTGPQTLHTVSHPARGHHVLLTSRSTSAKTEKNNFRTLAANKNAIVSSIIKLNFSNGNITYAYINSVYTSSLSSYSVCPFLVFSRFTTHS